MKDVYSKDNALRLRRNFSFFIKPSFFSALAIIELIYTVANLKQVRQICQTFLRDKTLATFHHLYFVVFRPTREFFTHPPQFQQNSSAEIILYPFELLRD